VFADANKLGAKGNKLLKSRASSQASTYTPNSLCVFVAPTNTTAVWCLLCFFETSNTNTITSYYKLLNYSSNYYIIKQQQQQQQRVHHELCSSTTFVRYVWLLIAIDRLCCLAFAQTVGRTAIVISIRKLDHFLVDRCCCLFRFALVIVIAFGYSVLIVIEDVLVIVVVVFVVILLLLIIELRNFVLDLFDRILLLLDVLDLFAFVIIKELSLW
jgi:hypothetical protein